MSRSVTSGPQDRVRRVVRALLDRLVELYRARELLRQLVRKELTVRYKGSVLGFAWSLLTPALMTVVFTVVFGFIFRLAILDFAAFFLSGFLAWQFFQNGAQGSVNAITGNGALIKKVYFPREVLPLSIVLSQLVHFLLALVAVAPYLLVARGTGWLLHLPAVVLGMVLLALFTAGIAMFLAGANAFFRDLQELIVVFFQIWFYATPVIYPIALVASRDSLTGNLFEAVIRLNPMTWFVKLFHDSIYGVVVDIPNPDDVQALATLGVDRATVVAAQDAGLGFLSLPASWPDADVLFACAGIALFTFVGGYWSFHRFAYNFAKQI